MSFCKQTTYCTFNISKMQQNITVLHRKKTIYVKCASAFITSIRVKHKERKKLNYQHLYFLLLQDAEFSGITNIHFKDSTLGLSLTDSNLQQSHGTRPSRDSIPIYSFINNQTHPLTRHPSKSLLPIERSSPPDPLLNTVATETLDLHKPMSDPGVKEQH